MTRQNAVNNEFDKVELSRWCTYIPGVANLTAGDGDAGAVWVFFVSFDLAYNHGMENFMPAVLKNVCELDEFEGVCAFHTLLPWPLEPFPVPWQSRTSSLV